MGIDLVCVALWTMIISNASADLRREDYAQNTINIVDIETTTPFVTRALNVLLLIMEERLLLVYDS